MSPSQEIIAVVGLGYVGLPVAMAMSTKFPTTGFDINVTRIDELQRFYDRTKEFSETELKGTSLQFSSETREIAKATVYIVTVPTPVDPAHQPDLKFLFRASELIASVLKKGDMVIYESTVFPGATRDKCAPILEKISGLKMGTDFDLGYSPERINPGDKDHSFTRIRKVVSAQDSRALERIVNIYGAVVEQGVFEAASIEVAEAAKVIENTQRDINIALVNELALILQHLNIDTNQVLETAGTKWNFLPFRPGLVGGHCIGVDPYYLTHCAQEVGFIPQVILAGRRTNDEMGRYVAQKTVKQLALAGKVLLNSTVTILGVTFKEDCPDARNSKVIDIVRELEAYGVKVQLADPHANADELFADYQLKLTPLNDLPPADAIVIAVAHKEYKKLQMDDFRSLSISQPILIDVKGIVPFTKNNSDCQLWRL